MQVQILSRKLVTPSTSTPSHLRSLKLASLNQLLPLVRAPLILYFQAGGRQSSVNYVEKSKQLQKALSETLTLFYPLAGRYISGNLFIDCNDEGAEYVEAQASGCLYELLKGGVLETELRNHLAPSIDHPDNCPLVSVQFNMFESGGLAIGICVSHLIGDGFSGFAFINALATACRTGNIDEVNTPYFELASLCPPRDVPNRSTMLVTPRIGSKNVMKRFIFSGATISKLKMVSEASASGSELSKCHPSRVEVVSAYMWRSLVKVAQSKRGRLTPSVLVFAVNMRGRTSLPIPEHSCGNLIISAIVEFMPDCNSGMQLHDFASRVHDAISNAKLDCAKASNGNDLFLAVSNRTAKVDELFKKGELDMYFLTSWCRFPMYEDDFGWGKPDWVTSTHAPLENLLMLQDTKDGEGIEAWIVLGEQNMLLFEQDINIAEIIG